MKKLMLIVLFGVLAVNVVFAQQRRTLDALTENQIKNLEDAILSGNDGLSKSGIYLACKYQLPQVENMLIAKLKTEDNPLNRVFIARVLFRISSEEGMKCVRQMVKSDPNQRVRIICAFLCEDYLNKEVKPLAILNQ